MKLCELRKEPYTMAELYKIVEEKLKKDGNSLYVSKIKIVMELHLG